MSDLRQRYAGTALQGLGSSPERERAVDVIGAAGRADSIGVDVWKMAYNLEKSGYIRLRRMALKAFQQRYPNESLAEKIVEQAIHEYCGPFCPDCGGTGIVGALQLNSPPSVCPTCGGHKMRHYTDAVRSATMKISYATTKRLGHKIAWTMKYLSGKDVMVNVVLNEQLERNL